MYKEIEIEVDGKKLVGGSYEIDMGSNLSYTMYLPPVGYGCHYNKYFDRNTSELNETIMFREVETLSSSDITEEQMWERPQKPDWYDERKEEEARIQEDDPSFVDHQCQAYEAQEWKRRLFGVWVMINGEARYINGSHYTYLAHWNGGTGIMKYRKTDMEWFHFYQASDMNPCSYGMTELTRRRQGKTTRAGFTMWEYVSRNKYVRGGIQSKNAEDAKTNVFKKAILQPFTELMDFWKPQYNEDKGDRSATGLFFEESSKRGKKSRSEKKKTVLNSFIDHKGSKPTAYDGSMLARWTFDEAFKLEKESIFEVWEVVKPAAELDGKVIGHNLITSTVEEMSEDSYEEAIKLWLASLPDTIDEELNQTKSGLQAYFLPAYRAYAWDKYGDPDEEEGVRYYNAQRKKLSDDPRRLINHKRKFPFVWQEAMAIASEQCLYNADIINNRLEALKWNDDDHTLRGDLIWKDNEKDTEVLFVPNSTGNFVFTKEFLNLFEKFNNVVYKAGGFKPMNSTDFGIGIDPFDTDIVLSGAGSMGAAAVWWKYDPSQEDASDNWVAYYKGRPQLKRIYYEDMIKLAWFLGAPVLIEDNKQGCLDWFEDRGMNHLAMKLKGAPKRGINSNQKNKRYAVDEQYDNIEKFGEKCPFVCMLEDWKLFDIRETEKFDIGMACLWSMVASKQSDRKVRNLKGLSKTRRNLVRSRKL